MKRTVAHPSFLARELTKPSVLKGDESSDSERQNNSSHSTRQLVLRGVALLITVMFLSIFFFAWRDTITFLTMHREWAPLAECRHRGFQRSAQKAWALRDRADVYNHKGNRLVIAITFADVKHTQYIHHLLRNLVDFCNWGLEVDVVVDSWLNISFLSKGNAFFCQYTGKPLNIIYHLHNRVQLF
jgi:hypothetical protein